MQKNIFPTDINNKLDLAFSLHQTKFLSNANLPPIKVCFRGINNTNTTTKNIEPVTSSATVRWYDYFVNPSLKTKIQLYLHDPYSIHIRILHSRSGLTYASLRCGSGPRQEFLSAKENEQICSFCVLFDLNSLYLVTVDVNSTCVE